MNALTEQGTPILEKVIFQKLVKVFPGILIFLQLQVMNTQRQKKSLQPSVIKQENNIVEVDDEEEEEFKTLQC